MEDRLTHNETKLGGSCKNWVTSEHVTSSDDPNWSISKQAAFLPLHRSVKNCSIVV